MNGLRLDSQFLHCHSERSKESALACSWHQHSASSRKGVVPNARAFSNARRDLACNVSASYSDNLRHSPELRFVIPSAARDLLLPARRSTPAAHGFSGLHEASN
jgi:hypothetical protein